MVTGQPAALIQSIVVATDFSERSEQAETYALALAQKFGATVVFVHAIEAILGLQEDDGSEEFVEFYARLTSRARLDLQGRVVQATERGISARYHVEVGQRWQIVLERAEAEDADLVVIGRRSYREHESVPLGTTSQRVYFASHRPVLIVPFDNGPNPTS
ncbi:MAG: universal stress protein [Bradymonadaceae bacterium]|nr:universal stress protein [Lujinxingiaceae bacterium]